MLPLKQILIEEIYRTNKQVKIKELQSMNENQLQRKLEQEILNKSLTRTINMV